MAERVLIQDTVSGVTISGNTKNGNLSKTNIEYRSVLEPYVDDYSNLKVGLGPLDNLTITTLNIDYPPDPDSAVLIDINDGSNHYEIGLYSGYSEIGVTNPTGTPLLEDGWQLKFYVEESEEEKFLDKVGLTYLWNKLKAYFQDKLVSGTNIKTINNTSLLGSGNIDIPSIDTSISDTSTNPVQNKVIKSYIDEREPAIEVQGDWHYRIYNDGSFEAWYGATGQTIVIQTSSGTLYRSDRLTLTLPTNLTNQGTTEIVVFNVSAGHNNYPVWASVASKTDTQINYFVISGGSRNTNPNYTICAYVYGLLT